MAHCQGTAQVQSGQVVVVQRSSASIRRVAVRRGTAEDAGGGPVDGHLSGLTHVVQANVVQVTWGRVEI